MSTRTDRRNKRPQRKAPKRDIGAIAAGAVAVIAIAAIIVFAVTHRNTQVTGAAVAPQSLPSLGPPLRAGQKAPDFSVRTPRGIVSSGQLAGKPYLLEIFATWCPHCQRMTSVLRGIRKTFPPSRLSMLSVTGSPISNESTSDKIVPENQQDVDTFESAWGVTWPTAFDKDLAVAQKFGLDGFPQIFIVNKSGTIVYSGSGEVPEKTLEKALKTAGA